MSFEISDYVDVDYSKYVRYTFHAHTDACQAEDEENFTAVSH